MSRFGHELIAASAGTGKTYQLTVRYLRLLFATGEPERIIALTFTRKAAGEFFEKIFHRLACAAADPAEASELARDIGLPVDSGACLRHLRLLLDRLHRLQLSTYDSFFSRVVRGFPFELGLGAPPELIDDHQRAEAVRRAQAELLSLEGEEERLQEFWHAFKRATMGREEKRTTDLLDAFIEEHQSLYLEEPDPARWGNPAAIWPEGCPWRETGEDPRQLAAAFSDALPWATLSAAQSGDWRAFLDALAEWRPPAELPATVRKFVVKFLEVLADLDRGSARITVRKRMDLTPELCDLGARLARTGVWMELAPRLVATRGIQELITLFERVYRDDVRSRGWLTIGDMTRLLSGGGEASGLEDEELRRQMTYRLDGAFDHWLLDEFQDTSHAQWRAIAGLVDEVIQDPEGRRSFFAVGDTKQCLYMWRGSDDKLFDRVSAAYGAALEQRKLSESYRSTGPVLAMVNGVFGASAAIGEVCGEEVAARWSRMWTDHRSAATLAAKPGYSCWLLSESDDEPRRRDLLRLLQGLDPLSRGLSVAVLTQTNADAAALVDYLRSEGLPCSLAAEVRPGRDNAASVALRSYLRVAAHPGDRLAWTHLRMTPAGEELERRHRGPEGLAEQVRRRASAAGMEGVVADWVRIAAPHFGEGNRFSPARMAECAAAAREFDAAGGIDIDAFVRELDALALRETDVPGQVAIMTVHKAKGLDWDFVILPDLEGNSLRERRRSIAVKRSAEGTVEWILQTPRKDIASGDAVLGAQIADAEGDAAFEQLCVLYVAMTRARLGLFVLSSDPARTKSANFVTLLGRALGPQPRDRVIGGQTFLCAWEEGQPAAAEMARPGRPPGRALDWQLAPIPEAERPNFLRRSPLRPSEEPEGGARRVLWRADHDAEDFGIAVHAVLARIEWLPAETSARSGALQPVFASCGESVRTAVEGLIRSAPGIFAKPAGRSELWRERAFEVMVGETWISGRFDRVVIRRDDAGRPVSAVVADFKTGRGADARRHTRQLEAYRQALSLLIGLDPATIELVVVAQA